MKTCESCKECVIIVGGDEVTYFCREICIPISKDDGRFCPYYKSVLEGE